jgi:hypothetical protein
MLKKQPEINWQSAMSNRQLVIGNEQQATAMAAGRSLLEWPVL